MKSDVSASTRFFLSAIDQDSVKVALIKEFLYVPLTYTNPIALTEPTVFSAVHM